MFLSKLIIKISSKRKLVHKVELKNWPLAKIVGVKMMWLQQIDRICCKKGINSNTKEAQMATIPAFNSLETYILMIVQPDQERKKAENKVVKSCE